MLAEADDPIDPSAPVDAAVLKRRGLPRASRERGGKAAKRGLSAEQIPVIVARDRTGATIDAVLPRLDAASITAALGQPASGTVLRWRCGDHRIRSARRVKFHVLPEPGTPKPEAPDLHINNVNACHGRLKEWMRRFHGVATKNLPSHLSWRRTIEALSNKLGPGRLDHGRRRIGSISTEFDIRAMSTPTTFGGTIQLFLVDDTPTGLIIASIHGWTGSVLVSTQSTFGRLLGRPEVDRTGIYLLRAYPVNTDTPHI